TETPAVKLGILRCTKCRCNAPFVNPVAGRRGFARCRSIEHGRIYERYGYHKRIGNAASNRFPAEFLPGLRGPERGNKSKGKAVGKVEVGCGLVSKSTSRVAKTAILAFLVAVMTVSWPLSNAAQASPRYAGIVIDAKTGKTLYQSHADEFRYPASLT